MTNPTPFLLTEDMWNDFLDMAVDASGSAGWEWFKDKYGLTRESLTELLLKNQEIVQRLKKRHHKLTKLLANKKYNTDHLYVFAQEKDELCKILGEKK